MRVNRTIAMATIFNPYDAVLDLRNKDDRKLFLDASKGLAESNLYDGSESKYSDFVKDMEKPFNDVRVMEVLKVPTKWDNDAATVEGKRVVTETMNIFDRYGVKQECVKTYVDLFWANTTFGVNTPKYHKQYTACPTDTAELTTERDKSKIKSIILGRKIWTLTLTLTLTSSH